MVTGKLTSSTVTGLGVTSKPVVMSKITAGASPRFTSRVMSNATRGWALTRKSVLSGNGTDGPEIVADEMFASRMVSSEEYSSAYPLTIVESPIGGCVLGTRDCPTT